ncbi:hypothetical protein [Streptomyces sp. NPDC060205]|uniref:hypothetical protein n=1 Tax=Streptomyces sp. NPDC060205 TaxID=3347072 RepID=UPI0036657BB2
MKLGKALATGVAEERPRTTDEELLLGEQVDAAGRTETTETTERAETAERPEPASGSGSGSGSEEVPVAR